VSVSAAFGRTGRELAGAGGSARGAWTPLASACAAAWLAAAIVVPFVGAIRIDAVAGDLYLAVAAVPLGFVVGTAGLPVLGFGAFMATGAFVAALLTLRAGWPFPPAALAGAAAAGTAGLAAGAAASRLGRVLVAASTWILAWLASLLLDAFPSISGGAQGLAFDRPGSFLGLELSATVHFELALVLLALAILGSAQLARERFGLALAAARQQRSDAEALGVPAARLRLVAFASAAAAGGLVGALSADAAGVADPNAFGAFLSLKLFVAVLVGGAAYALGPPVGVSVVVLVLELAHPLASLLHVESARFAPALAGILLLAVLGTGSNGVAALAEPLVPRRTRAAAAARPPAAAGRTLRAQGLRKTFGEVVALDGVTLELEPGTVHALVGPNGSGKTTALRILAGSLAPDAGRVLLDGRPIDGLTQTGRVREGVVATPQGGTGFPELTALEHVVVGSAVHARHAGAARTLVATPLARAEAASARAAGRALLERVGLGEATDVRAELLGGPQRSLLLVAAALAAGARVLLLDEPGAGATPDEAARLVETVRELREDGLAILLVEHDLRLVRALADTVTVLDAGRAIATGSPDGIARDPAVRRAYLGKASL